MFSFYINQVLSTLTNFFRGYGEYDHCACLLNVLWSARTLVYQFWCSSPSSASLCFLLLRYYRKGPKDKYLRLMGCESKTACPADLGCTFISPLIQDNEWEWEFTQDLWKKKSPITQSSHCAQYFFDIFHEKPKTKFFNSLAKLQFLFLTIGALPTSQ